MEIKATLNKPYTEAARINFIVENNHQLGYEIKETDVALEAWGMCAEELLEQVKNKKITENNLIRDAALLQGVTYKNIVFDSDTDQKVNLREACYEMSDEDTITWFGMNNDVLECTKEDLLNIGALIRQLTAFIWTRNTEIKALINAASTAEEVDAIEIDYTMEEE